MSYGLWNQPPPIRVYPPDETAFATNGLRCLFPQSAEVTLREQQAHSIRLVHPVDDDGAWKSLQLHNILYVPIEKRGVMTFQPMRIYKIQKQRKNGGKLSITVDAKHVFYDLNSVIVQACTISAASCLSAIGSTFSSVYRPTANAQACDAFSYSSDISATASAQYDNVTLTAALIGDESSIASLYGGELYVDGFRFSINSRMEGALDNAFVLSYAINMIGITATYDADAQYSAVVGSSGTSSQTRIADAASVGLPFDRTIYAKFSYKSGTPAQQFSDDLDRYADTAKQVNASYQVTFADLSKYDDYSGFANLSTFEVGDTGTVYDEYLDIQTNQKIVEKKIDVLSQTVLSVKLGNIPASITQQAKFANTVSNNMTISEKDQSVMESQITGEAAETSMQKDALAEIIDSGGEKNLIYDRQTTTTQTSRGLTVVHNPSAGTITVNGTHDGTGDARFDLYTGSFQNTPSLPRGEYVFSVGKYSGGSTVNGWAWVLTATGVTHTGNDITFTVSDDTRHIAPYLLIRGGTYTNYVFTAMLCKKAYWDISKKFVPGHA